MTYQFHCKKCGYTSEALSKYQRKIIKKLHRAKRCGRVYPTIDLRGREPTYHMVREQIAGVWT